MLLAEGVEGVEEKKIPLPFFEKNYGSKCRGFMRSVYSNGLLF